MPFPLEIRGFDLTTVGYSKFSLLTKVVWIADNVMKNISIKAGITTTKKLRFSKRL